MGTGYTRQSASDILDGHTVFAGPLNVEFNALQAAFSGTVGHAHDGTTGEGPKINLTTSITGVLPQQNGGFGAVHKLDATSAPLGTDDINAGYGPGSLWVDLTNGFVWICVDNTSLDAKWRRLTQTITGTANQIEVADGDGTAGEPTISIASNFLPVGTIIADGGSTPPTGWILAYGQPISRTTYAALFARYGTTHGAGNGSTTFNVPDLRGRVLAGLDNMGSSSANRLATFYGSAATTLGGTLGSQSVTLTIAQLPSHPHTFSGTSGSSGSHTHTYSGSSNTGNAGSHTHSLSVSGTLTGTAASGGAHTHTVSATGTTNTTGAHQHNYRVNASGSTTNLPYGASGSAFQANPFTDPAGDHSHTVSVSGSAASNGAHTHSVSVSGTSTGTSGSAGTHNHSFSWSGTTSNDGAHTHTYSGTTSSVGNGDAHGNAQPTYMINYIIKAF